MPCPNRSHSSHRSHWSYSFFFLLLAARPSFCAQPAARALLPETAAFDRVDGRILHVDANDTWLFALTAEVKTPAYRLPAGARFVLLPSATLGRLSADANERVAPRYRLSARVTRFQGQNYLFATSYLPLSKFKADKNPEGGEQKAEESSPNQKSKIENQRSEEPELVIPPEVLEQLKKQPPLRGPRRRTEAQEKPTPEDRVLADCVGRIEDCRVGSQPTRSVRIDPVDAWGKTPPYVFMPYALGWNLSGIRYELLPCAALEQALQVQTRALDPLRFSVAGLVTEFQGKKYLLLQRAVVAYNYGNFGR